MLVKITQEDNRKVSVSMWCDLKTIEKYFIVRAKEMPPTPTKNIPSKTKTTGFILHDI